jgi:wobble nucleotide-excising tRNase
LDKFQDCNIQGNLEHCNKYVYNSDFILKTIIENKEIKGIYTFQENNETIQEQIEENSIKISQNQENIQTRINTTNNKTTDLRELKDNFYNDIWKNTNEYRKNIFIKAFDGFNGSKEKLAEELLKHTKNNDIEENQLIKQYSIAFSDEQEKIPFQKISDFYIQQISSVENLELLNLSVVGVKDLAISKVIEDLNNSDWVKKGKSYLENSENICPFCQNKITEDFQTELEKYFDENFEKQITQLENSLNDYKSTTDYILNHIKHIEELNLLVSNLTTLFHDNINLLEKKFNNPSEKVNLNSSQDLLNNINYKIAELNREIEAKNEIIRNRKSSQTQLKKDIWEFLANKFDAIITNYKSDKKGVERAIQNIENQKVTLENEIADLEQTNQELSTQITSILPTIQKINSFLEQMNFKSFKLAECDTLGFYRIDRLDGEHAHTTLSEGEKTFISFIYFYELLKENQDKKIIVFDDPISSLDSNTLFIISTMIKNLIEETRQNNNNQIFILTHNVSFFREVSYNFSRQKYARLSDETFWILQKQNNISKIAHYQKVPIQTSYELLWQEVRDNQSSISIQNTYRRIIEYYFKLIGNIDYKKILEQFAGEKFFIAQSLIAYINYGSHSPFEETEISISNNENIYNEVFKDIFQYTGQIGHFNMMMGETINDH